MNGELKIISLFAGCGGSSMGYKLAGFKEILAIDNNKNSAEALRLNFNFPIWQRNITTIEPKEILEFCNIKKGELDILDGSPPCQGFSTCGKRKIKDKRNNLYKSFIKIINGLSPRVFVMENVTGMIKGKMKGKFNEIIKELNSTNYNVKCKLLNAKYYNVPQSRERLIFIGVRKDINITNYFPKPIDKILRIKDVAVKNTEEELKEAYDLTPNYIKPYLEKMKDYECASKYIKSKSYFSMKRNGYYKPSRTITKTPSLFHHNENRFLTRSELKIYASFPEYYKFSGNLKNIYNRIGNSVPPKMMKAIAENLKNELEKIC
jgi:DNA (cytosine-5)-methyltransferase 1